DGDAWRLHSGVIAPEVHASYPCVVRDGDDVYCVPETAHLGRAEAWRCVDFPLRWERVGTVIDGVPIVDPTALRHDGRWWLLGGRLDDEPNAKLFAWWSDSLFGPWQSHPLNPVLTDVTAGRPAGTPFVHDGRLFRPAQDGSLGYGTALRICEITALDERHYEERVGIRVATLPGPYARGVHTLTHDGNYWVLDAKRNVFDVYDARTEI